MAIITRLGLYGGPRAPYPGFVAAAANAVVSGTAVGVLESEVVAGGETIIITLANDTWVAAGATFNAQRQNIIDGLDSGGAEVAGWNAEVRDKEVVTAVVRTSDTVVTITLTAAPAYAIDADETVTVTVPATALTAAGELVATPTFDVTAEAVASTGGSWLSPEQVRKLRQIVKDAQDRKEETSRRRQKRVTNRRQELERIYDEVNGLIPVEAAPEIRGAIEQHSSSSDVPIPPAAAINWAELLENIESVENLARAMLEAEGDDEEIVLLMMVA